MEDQYFDWLLPSYGFISYLPHSMLNDVVGAFVLIQFTLECLYFLRKFVHTSLEANDLKNSPKCLAVNHWKKYAHIAKYGGNSRVKLKMFLMRNGLKLRMVNYTTNKPCTRGARNGTAK